MSNSKRLICTIIAAGLGFGLNTVIAQNVDSDKDKAQGQEQVMRDKEQGSGQSSGNSSPAMRNFNDAGERQVGLEQYLMEQQQCGSMAPEGRGDCMQMAKVRYESWAVMQCQLVAGVSQQRCYQNVQAAVLGNRNTAGQNPNGNPESGAVRRGNEDKPARQ